MLCREASTQCGLRHCGETGLHFSSQRSKASCEQKSYHARRTRQMDSSGFFLADKILLWIVDYQLVLSKSVGRVEHI